jgi:hypothetical protein
VTLVQETSTFAKWRSRNFANTAGSLEAFATTDPGGKGVPALLRYAFGMDPLNPDRARLPKLVVRDGHLTLDVWQRPGATDLEFVVEVSADMVHWESSVERVERLFPAELATNAEALCFRARQAISEAPQLFLNLRVLRRP